MASLPISSNKATLSSSNRAVRKCESSPAFAFFNAKSISSILLPLEGVYTRTSNAKESKEAISGMETMTSLGRG